MLDLSCSAGGPNELLGEIEGYKVEGQIYLDVNSFRDAVMTILPRLEDACGYLLLTNESLWSSSIGGLVRGQVFEADRLSVLSLSAVQPYQDTGLLFNLITRSNAYPSIGLARRIDMRGNIIEIGKTLEEKNLTDKWFWKLCSIAAHELLHLFGIDHCDILECTMQPANAHTFRQTILDGDCPLLCDDDTEKLGFAILSGLVNRLPSVKALKQ